LLICLAAAAADRRPVSPPAIKPIGPYSPGILTKDFLYVSGQGAKDAKGEIAATQEAQLRQCFENVKTIVEAAGLTMEHVVYTQVYLTDASDEGPLNRVWKEYFPKMPPARSTIGVAKLPGTPVEMSAVAVRDLARKKPVVPPNYPPSSPLSAGVLAGDRLFLSGFLGRDINTGRIPEDAEAQVELSLDRMQATLKAAGLDFRHMVFVNPYLTDKIPMGVMNRVYARRGPLFRWPGCPAERISSSPAWQWWTWRSGARCGQRTCRRARRPARACSPPTRFIAPRSRALFPEPTAAFMPIPSRRSFARPCAICSTGWRKPV
jgi:reactive intermediate/imine deaminase